MLRTPFRDRASKTVRLRSAKSKRDEDIPHRGMRRAEKSKAPGAEPQRSTA
jgi:hypothetical protein